MATELLTSAYEVAQRSKADVRVAALLRIARVQTAFERGHARKTFGRALEEIRQIRGRDGRFLLEHARLFAAAIAPDVLPSIPFEHHVVRLYEDRIGRTMIEHGHLQAALEFVMRYDDASTFPFHIAAMLLERVNAQKRLALVRRAVAAWHEAHGDKFVWLFQSEWKLLPDQEARGIVREVVRVALDDPDLPMEAAYGQEGTIKITSVREFTLFRVLHILRHLDQPLLESLLSSHPQFAAAAGRFPYGEESIMREAEERKKSDGESCGGFVMAGSSDDFPYLRALMRGSRDGDFEQAMEHAQRQYRKDAAPEDRNLAPAEFWPSASQFRSILYAAGKRLGASADRYLARIDDPDLRLFAQIELAAALADLPEFRGIQRSVGQRRHMCGIRCPKCNSIPHRDERWRCKCGNTWNIFETSGSCPACRYHWNVTECLLCGETSAHSDWFLQP